MRISAPTLVFPMLIACAANGDTGSELTLTLPHALRAGETAWLEVSVGVLAHGKEIDITTTSGRPLGTISPFVNRIGQEVGHYAIPLPPDAISGDRIALRLSLGNERRALTQDEVRSVRLTIGATR